MLNSRPAFINFYKFSIIAILLIGIINPAGAQTFDSSYQPYISISAGWQNRDRAAESDVIWTDWDRGYDYNVALGVKLFKKFRIEAEASRLRNEAKTMSGGPDLAGPATGGTADLTSYTINAYFDYAIPNTPIELFAGLGYGTYTSELDGLTNAKISPNGFIFTGSSTYAPIWQGRLGLTYSFNENFQFFATYRYFDGDKIKFTFNLPNGIEFHAGPKESVIQSGEIGLRYLF